GVRGNIARGRVAVLDLLIEVARGQRAQVRREVRLAADGAAGVHELMQAVAVGLLLAPEGGARGARLGSADAVAPVVGVREAAAGPAQQRRLDGLERIDEALAHAAGIGDLGIRPDPDAVIDYAAKLLDKVAVDLGRDGRDRLGGKDVDVRVDGRGALREEARAAQSKRGGSCGGGLEGGATGDFHGRENDSRGDGIGSRGKVRGSRRVRGYPIEGWGRLSGVSCEKAKADDSRAVS